MASITIGSRKIGDDAPCYIIAEISCNHEGDLQEARRIIKAASDGGADAVKIQTYTPDTISADFKTKADGTIWEDIDLYALYEKAQTPWNWSFELRDYAKELGVDFFSSPFDETAVDFLVNELGVPALKVASFEVVDTKLLEKIAKTGLPVIMSNGMTDFLEMQESVRTLKESGCKQLALLHCNSGYPAAFEEANLKTMTAMREIFGCPVGVSDHTLFANADKYEEPLAHLTPVEAVKLGAKIVEVHLTMDRTRARELFGENEGGYDWPFSMEPAEFKKMCDMIRTCEREGAVEYTAREEEIALRTHGSVCFAPTEKEMASRKARPSLWVMKPVKKGDRFHFAAEDKENGNFDSIRPAGGLPIRFTDFVEGKAATRNIDAGDPLSWDMIEAGN